MIDIQLLKKISETSGAPGYEQRIRAFVMEQVSPFVDEISTDAMGNVITVKKGKTDKKVMIAAHLDEIGFVVKHIDEQGFIRFHTLGGFDPKTLTAQRVIIHGEKDIIGVMGCKPIHLMSPEERNKGMKITDYFIDTGMSVEKVEKYISVGDSITRKRELIQMGDCVNGKSLDNRVSVYILLEMLRELKDTEVPYDIYAVFSVQEEVGIRGAEVAAHQINPDFGFGLDVTIAFDIPGSAPHEKVTSLGEGTAIKIMDSSTICDYRMVRFLKQTANKHNIKWQPEILTGGGTDTAGVQRKGQNGSIAGALSIPTRHIHQSIEMSNIADIRATIDLLKQAVLEIDTYDWSFR
ncbi:MAG: M42 family metallopeptidase [Saprospiraceae bacterium]|nr:M42 family metallopeptidase [Saprospiraceae bacterium]